MESVVSQTPIEIRCTKCNKKLGEIISDIKLVAACCDKKQIIYKTRCPRCKEEVIALSKKNILIQLKCNRCKAYNQILV